MYELNQPLDHASFGMSPSEAMVRFIHDCCPDPQGREVVVAAEVFSLWQMAGRFLTPHPPGYLLVNHGEPSEDTLAQLPVFNTGLFSLGPPDLAPGETADPEGRRSDLEFMRAITGLCRVEVESAPERVAEICGKFREAWTKSRRKVFGEGRAAGYADRWDEKMGLITDMTDTITLLVDREDDWELFHKHATTAESPLLEPRGCNESLLDGPKVVSVVGSVKLEQMDQALVTAILERALPILVLPYPGGFDQGFLRSFPMESLAVRFADAHISIRSAPLVAPVNLPTEAFPILHYEGRIRERARFLPSGYGYFLLRMLREVGQVCLRIAVQAAGPKDGAFTVAISDDLHHLTTRAVVTSVECLVFHGWGFEPGIPRPLLNKMLEYLRGAESRTIRDLQRKVRELKAEELKSVLDILTREGLIEMEGKVIRAVSFAEFANGLQGRCGFPAPTLYTQRNMDAFRRRENDTVSRSMPEMVRGR